MNTSFGSQSNANAPISVTLHKAHRSQKLGISLVDDFDGAVRIVKLAPNSISCQSELQLYDKLLSVNGQYILGNANEAIQLLREFNLGHLTLVVTRDLDSAGGGGNDIDVPAFTTRTRTRTLENQTNNKDYEYEYENKIHHAKDAPMWNELHDLLNQSVKSLTDGPIIDLDREELNRTLSRSSTITTTFTTFNPTTSTTNYVNILPSRDHGEKSLTTNLNANSWLNAGNSGGIYTVYLQKFSQNTKLGVNFAKCTDGSIVISSLDKGYEAYESSLNVGDRIMSVDGHDVGCEFEGGMSGTEMVAYLRNLVGTVRIVAETSKGMVRMEKLLNDDESSQSSEDDELDLVKVQNQDGNAKEYYICTTSAVIHQPMEKIQSFLFRNDSFPLWHRRVKSVKVMNEADICNNDINGLSIAKGDTIKCTYYNGAHVLEDVLHVSKREFRLAVQPKTIQTLVPIMEHLEKFIKIDRLGGNATNVTVSVKYRTKYMPWTKFLAEGIIRRWMEEDASACADGTKYYTERSEQVTEKTKLKDLVESNTIKE